MSDSSGLNELFGLFSMDWSVSLLTKPVTYGRAAAKVVAGKFKSSCEAYGVTFGPSAIGEVVVETTVSGSIDGYGSDCSSEFIGSGAKYAMLFFSFTRSTNLKI